MSVDVQLTLPSNAINTPVKTSDISPNNDSIARTGTTPDVILLCKPKLHVRKDRRLRRKTDRIKRERADTETSQLSAAVTETSEQSESTSETSNITEREKSIVASEANTDATSIAGDTYVVAFNNKTESEGIDNKGSENVDAVSIVSESNTKRSIDDSHIQEAVSIIDISDRSTAGDVQATDAISIVSETTTEKASLQGDSKTDEVNSDNDKSPTNVTKILFYQKQNGKSSRNNHNNNNNNNSLLMTTPRPKTFPASKIPTPQKKEKDKEIKTNHRDVGATGGNTLQKRQRKNFNDKQSIEEEIDAIAKKSLQLIKKTRIKREIKLVSESLGNRTNKNKDYRKERTRERSQLPHGKSSPKTNETASDKTDTSAGKGRSHEHINSRGNDITQGNVGDQCESSDHKENTSIPSNVTDDSSKQAVDQLAAELSLKTDLTQVTDSGSECDLYGPRPPKTPLSTRQNLISGLENLSPVNLDPMKMDQGKDNGNKDSNATGNQSSTGGNERSKGQTNPKQKSSQQQISKPKSHVKSFKVGIKRQRSYVKSATPDPNRCSQKDKN